MTHVPFTLDRLTPAQQSAIETLIREAYSGLSYEVKGHQIFVTSGPADTHKALARTLTGAELYMQHHAGEERPEPVRLVVTPATGQGEKARFRTFALTLEGDEELQRAAWAVLRQMSTLDLSHDDQYRPVAYARWQSIVDSARRCVEALNTFAAGVPTAHEIEQDLASS